ncbi:MAG: racemase [Verrucomicrobia bacterium]|nr:racemase [Verrucomicrobiota bacterium]
MKCLGLIGGIGWEATALYYRLINEDVRRRLGSLHSARAIVNSLSFDPLDTLVQMERWAEAAGILADAARQLEQAGAEAILICSSQMHCVAEQVQAAVDIPLLHLGAAIGQSLGRARDDIGLLCTRFTAERGFLLEPRPDYPHWRKRRIHTAAPADAERLDQICRELGRGVARPESGVELLRIAKSLRIRGARRVILAASELALLPLPEAAPLWLDDGTELHVSAAVSWALGEAKPPADFSRSTMSEHPGGPLLKRSRVPAFA